MVGWQLCTFSRYYSFISSGFQYCGKASIIWIANPLSFFNRCFLDYLSILVFMVLLWWDYLQILKIYSICKFLGFLIYGKSSASFSLNIIPLSFLLLSPSIFPIDIWWTFLLYSLCVYNHLKNLSLALFLWIAFVIFASILSFTNLYRGMYMSKLHTLNGKLPESLEGTAYISS